MASVDLSYPPKSNVRDFQIRMLKMFWTPEEIQYDGMEHDWNHLSLDEQNMLKFILLFFAFGDDKVIENLGENLIKTIAKKGLDYDYAYTAQKLQEQIHSETYARLYLSLIEEHEGKHLLENFESCAGVKELSDWINRYIACGCFEEQLVAFIAVEGGIFNPLFAFIRSLTRVQGIPLFSGLTIANDLIARDEACHAELGGFIFQEYKDKISKERIMEILNEATICCAGLILGGYGIFQKYTDIHSMIEIAKKYDGEMHMNVSPESLIKFACFTMDFLMSDIMKLPYILYGYANPLSFMDAQALNTTKMTDFFASVVSTYQAPIIQVLKMPSKN